MRTLTALVCGLALTSMACTFTIPSPPTASARDSSMKITPSPAARAMARVVTDPDAKELILDEAWRCENRLSALVSKMSTERTMRGMLTLGGGIVSAGGGITSVVLKDDDAKTATAIVAAAGGLIALGSQLVGEPAKEIQLYEKALAHYEKARSASADAFEGSRPCSKVSNGCFMLIRAALAQCSDENATSTVVAEPSSSQPAAPPTAAPGQ